MNKLIISILTIILLATIATAVTFENQYGRITVTPDVIFPHSDGMWQQAEFCSYINQPVDINLAFLFRNRLSNGEIQWWNGANWLDATDQISYNRLNPRNYGFDSDNTHSYSYQNWNFDSLECQTVKWHYNSNRPNGKWDMALWTGTLQNPTKQWLLDPYYNNTWYHNGLTETAETNDIDSTTTLNITYGDAYAYLRNQTISSSIDIHEVIPTPVKDTYIDNVGEGSTNFGSSATFVVGHVSDNSVLRGLIAFDLAPGTTIMDGQPEGNITQVNLCELQLRVNAVNTPPFTIDAYPMYDNWTETTVTNDNVGTIGSTANSSDDIGSPSSPNDVNITIDNDLCKDMLNNKSVTGILLYEHASTGDKRITFESKESSPDPILHVTFSEEVLTDTMVNATYGDLVTKTIPNIGTYTTMNCSLVYDINSALHSLNMRLSNDAGNTWNNVLIYQDSGNNYYCNGTITDTADNKLVTNITMTGGTGSPFPAIHTPYLYNFSVWFLDWTPNISIEATNQTNLTEGSTTYYYLNITVPDDDVVAVNASLWYNNTQIDLINFIGNETDTFKFNTSLPVGTFILMPENFPIDNYWNITIETSADNYSTTYPITQSVTLIEPIFTRCNETYTDVALNYTLQDEQNSSEIIGTISGTWTYYPEARSGQVTTYTFTESGQTNYTFCIYPSEFSFNVQEDFQYHNNPDYPTRYRQQNTTRTNTSEIIPLKLLLSTNGIFARFRTIDQSGNVISGVQVTMKDTNGNTIDVQQTDSAGQATFFVDYQEYYTFTFTKAGYSTYTLDSVRITSTDVTNIILESTATGSVTHQFAGINVYFTPTNSILNNGTNYEIYFNMTSTFWNISSCSYDILYQENSTTIQSGTTNLWYDTCNGTTTYLTDENTSIYARVTYSINDTSSYVYNKQYSTRYEYQGTQSLTTFIDDLKAFSSAGFNNFTLMLIALLIIFAILASLYYTTSIKDPEILVTILLLLVWLFSYVGFFMASSTPIATPDAGGLARWTGDFLKQYIIAILISMLGIGYLIWKQE